MILPRSHAPEQLEVLEADEIVVVIGVPPQLASVVYECVRHDEADHTML